MNAEQSEFLKAVVPAAQYSQRSYGVPASITIAQAMLESGWGRTQLAKECNNYFGIKAGHYETPGTYQAFPTHEFVDGKEVLITANFMKYASLQLCFGAHARLLAIAPRYKSAMAERGDPTMFAVRLQDCGYSTNPRYSAGLMALVKQFDLTQYDKEPEPPVEASIPAEQEEKAA